MLFPPEQRLLDAATAIAAGLPDDPYALHTVSAAVMTVDGDIFTGVNVEHFTGGPCAEIIALGAAATAGARPIAECVAVGNEGRGVLAPCGRCRQILFDQHPDCRVIIPGEPEPEVVDLVDLLPYGFEFPDWSPPRLLRFNSAYWEAVVDGTKTATTRYGERCRLGEVTMLFEFDDQYRNVPGVVESIDKVRLIDIDDEMAALEGCTADELRAGLRAGHYADLTDDALVDFVRFRVASA